MVAAPTPLPPGSLTVPLWSGWAEVALVLMLVLVLGLAAFVALAAGRGGSSVPEWQARLDGRPTGRGTAGPQGSDTPSR